MLTPATTPRTGVPLSDPLRPLTGSRERDPESWTEAPKVAKPAPVDLQGTPPPRSKAALSEGGGTSHHRPPLSTVALNSKAR